MTTEQIPASDARATPGSRRSTAAARRFACGLGAVWVATRLGMLALLAQPLAAFDVGTISGEVHQIYYGWYGQLAQGGFPLDDVMWQYPPGAALVILGPGALPWLTYFQAFLVLTLAADGLLACALARAGLRPGRRTDGAWLWVGALPLLLHLPLVRYDVQVTALAVLALLALQRHPRIGGALAGLGATVKVWPVLALLGAPRGRTTREAWLSAAAGAAALLAVLAFGFSHTLGFLRQQGSRGVQIESAAGTVLSLARLAGWPGTVEYRYGAMELTGPYVPALAHASLVLTAAAFCWLLLWRIRARRWTPATPFDAALAAVLLFTVTSRVISPQYLVWLLGLAAVCLTSRATTQRPVAALLLPAAALSALAYPVLYDDVVSGSPLGCALMVVRNLLLLAAALLSCHRLWASSRSTGAVREKGRPAPE
ncbi:glycosyltransferase family 87 protein [Streptomyces chryseus]|uniref:Membrane protein n=1 Tax=Streptomyces chryseus TaxID=68186 RepID=A0ABQ3DY30_9ACTN|nr:membrane protein [Streptomyces chryseus]